MSLHPWAEGPFELILHAEMHHRIGDDLDRRIALIGFDNAIEVSITTYLSLHPIQRQNRTYQQAQVATWLSNYHSKVDFFETECGLRGVTIEVERAHIIWYHQIRNRQYHEGGSATPNIADLRGVRRAALWIFGVLYNVVDVEALLNQRIAALTPPAPPQRTADDDAAIDNTYDRVEIAGRQYLTSELLYAFDPTLYSEIARELKEEFQTQEQQ